MENVVDILKQRGLLEQCTSETLGQEDGKPLSVYCGFDPTAESLHLGHLVAIIGLSWFQRCGHRPFALIGGATGMIGDPSGKSRERPLLDEQSLERNVAGIRRNLETFLDFHHPTAPAQIVNNYDWFKNFSFIDFLSTVGRQFRMGPMLAKDSVKSRLHSEEGMSFTEFSYQVLQAYDFQHLYESHGVTLQIGGSDQWGNITAGTELIRKTHGATSAQALTFPLLTRSDGKKFGKSEKGAIWLSADKLSPYEFYQYLFRTPDADVIKLLRMLTFLELAEVRALESSMGTSAYRANTAQERLARELTLLVHGEEGLKQALKATEGVKPGADAALDAQMLDSIAADVPSAHVAKQEVMGVKYIDLLVSVGAQKSKGEARRLIKQGGAYLNNSRVEDEGRVLEEVDLIAGRLLLLGMGRKKKFLIQVTE